SRVAKTCSCRYCSTSSAASDARDLSSAVRRVETPTESTPIIAVRPNARMPIAKIISTSVNPAARCRDDARGLGWRGSAIQAVPPARGLQRQHDRLAGPPLRPGWMRPRRRPPLRAHDPGQAVGALLAILDPLRADLQEVGLLGRRKPLRRVQR